MGAVTVKVDASGRVVIPKELREQLGIPEGGELRLSVEDGELRGAARLAALRRIQRRMAELVPPGVSLVDELIVPADCTCDAGPCRLEYRVSGVKR